MADINDPQKLFAHKIGTALSMENTVLKMLEQLEKKAVDEELKQKLRRHHDETQQQIQNLEQVFSSLGQKPQRHASPAIDGIKQEGQELLQKVPQDLVDSVILGGAEATEHHEIAVYEGLITKAEAMGEDDIVALLQENLEIEQHTLREVQQKARQVAQRTARITT